MTVEKEAATRIQQYWGGFWPYSHSINLRFEIVCIQDFDQGWCAQHNYLALRHDCATVIQGTASCLLANINCHMKRLITAMVQSASTTLSTRLTSKRIQRCYRDTQMTAKKKHATLIIKRFISWQEGRLRTMISCGNCLLKVTQV
jgi:hypothetical protein